MMRYLCFVLYGSLLFWSVSCQPRTSSSAEKLNTLTTSPQQVSQDYQVPVFKQDYRIQKIQSLKDTLHDLFSSKAEENHFPGMVYGIIVDDSLVFSGAYGVVNLESRTPVNANSRFRIASMTKSFVCMAILKLRDAGKLKLDLPAASYLPELKELEYLTADAPLVTIEHLMTMSAGFPEDNPWADRQLEDSEEEFSEFLQNGISMSNLPGMAYEYSNLGYAILGRIVSRVSGQPYQEYIRQEILEPLGMHNTRWEYVEVPKSSLAIGYRWEAEKWKPEPMLHDGAFGAIGGLITSLNDFSRYLSFHLSAWPARNEPDDGPIRRSTLREMHQMKNPRLYADALDHQGNLCPVMAAYAYGLGIYEDCNGVRKISHSGGLPGFGSEYQFYPEWGIGLISFANRTYAPARSINNDIMQFISSEVDLEKRSSPPSPVLLQRSTEVMELIQYWDETLEENFIAENFYLDQSRALRKAEADEIWSQAGKLVSVDEVKPINQLRGTFIIHCEQRDIEVFFSLSPEKNPKVQAIRMRLANAS